MKFWDIYNLTLELEKPLIDPEGACKQCRNIMGTAAGLTHYAAVQSTEQYPRIFTDKILRTSASTPHHRIVCLVPFESCFDIP